MYFDSSSAGAAAGAAGAGAAAGATGAAAGTAAIGAGTLVELEQQFVEFLI